MKDDDIPFYDFVPSVEDGDQTIYTIKEPEPPNYKLHFILFVITFLSTTISGAAMAGYVRPSGFFSLFSIKYLSQGLSFSIPLMFILLTHEMGHFIASKIHRVDATLPYFIPAPTMIGTFGAFIKMRSPIYDKRALVDIGAAGPLSGFIVSIPILILGLSLSKIVPATGGGYGIKIGSSLMVQILAEFFAPNPAKGFDLLIHPMGFAGWIGLFVTSLNLIPIGQLDGGHVAYAFFGEKYEKFAKFILLFLVFMGLFWGGWLLWAVIIFFLGRKHPPAVNPYMELDLPRKIIVWVVLAIFVLTFIPVPFRF